MYLFTGCLYVILQTLEKYISLLRWISVKCHLETHLEKLFESKRNVRTIGVPDAKIIFTKAPFLQYEQFLLDKNFRQYLETILVSKKYLRMDVQKTRIRKTYEMSVGSDTINVDFIGSDRQFD